MEFMPEHAPLVVLMFLGACFVLGVAGTVAVYELARGKRALTKCGLVVALAGAGAYAGLLFAVSLASRERVLGLGEQKYFCEVDCHVAYAVEDVATTKLLGAPPDQATAAGTFYVVRVKTWFDERTISSHRGYATLKPNPQEVVVVDDQGRQFLASPAGSRALEQARGKRTPLTTPLQPGESYTTEFVFDLPADAQNPRLLITNADRMTAFLIGHENSPLHKKILFRLASQLSFLR